ncbi:MAG: hypothetical protein PHR25_02755 [Clostridia bacterium]|nr:hypothetical protein [Clostridia bacterium]MDD4375680.1 hypothetical protein [Clostridia bacterium]
MTIKNLKLENGIYPEGTYSSFKLYYKGYALTEECSNIAYINNKLIAVKAVSGVFIYKPEVICNDNGCSLIPIAFFKAYDSSAYMKVSINGIKYIIDSNVQIKRCDCIPLH